MASTGSAKYSESSVRSALARRWTIDDGPPSIVHRRSSHTGTPMLVALLATVGSVAAHGGRPLSTTLTGPAEIAGGDPDGSGSASITLNHCQGEICFELSVSGIAPATAAHIRSAPAGVNGPVVVPLTPPASGSSSGCTSADPNLIKAIIQHQENYYVNIHNVDFPGGALRGQLSK
jgi:hypothetical protein